MLHFLFFLKVENTLLRIDEFLHHHPFLFLLIITLFSLYFFPQKMAIQQQSTAKQQKTASIASEPTDLGKPSPAECIGTRYGPLMLLHFGSKPVIIVQSPDAAREIMKTNDLLFADKPHSRTARRLFYDLRDISIAPYGEYWRKLKSICVLQLLSRKRVQSFDLIRVEETALLMKKMESCICSPVNLCR